MEVLDRHHQIKRNKRLNTLSECELVIYVGDDFIGFTQEVISDYLRFNNKKRLTTRYNLTVDTKNGNISCTRSLINEDLSSIGNPDNLKVFTKNTKNKFHYIEEFCDDGFLRGEKRSKFWGVRYERSVQRMFQKVHDILRPMMVSDYYDSKDYINKPVVSPLYDLLVDFHLFKKKIKGHDMVYHTIQMEYPQVKYLKLNDYKFLSSVLDQYGIKSKFIIGEINKLTNGQYSVRALSYICNLFGDNYIDYIKKITNWERLLYDGVPNRKYHTLKNSTEKQNLISLINHWESNGLMDNSVVFSLNQLLVVRDYLEDKGFNLKFTAKDDDSFEILQKEWSSIKAHVKKGYRLRYSFPEDFIQSVEDVITTKDGEFIPTIIKCEDDFVLEGHIMKNCMSNHFRTGSIYVYISMTHKNKRINLQYRRGCLTQSYGKANSTVEPYFQPAISQLNKIMSRYSDLVWKKEKFDFI